MKVFSTLFRLFPWKFIALSGAILLCSLSSYSQNTKGDKPVKNQRQIRETRVKSVKKKERGKTKDIAGRRLRTKDKSSANRANANYPQPDPYSGRPRVTTDRSTKSTGRIFSQQPRERQRSWRGDVSGSAIRRVKPRSAEAARSNVYPQRGFYVNNPSKKPKKEGHRVYHRTATGQPLVKRVPQQKQRAWRGNIRGGVIGAPSATGTIKNTYPQKNQFTKYNERARRAQDKPMSNRGELARVARLSTHPKSKAARGTSPASASRPFIQRGRRNVYWGKFSKGERPVTNDLTGRPVRTRNYRSVPAGLVDRDTIKFFGRKPGGDRAYKGRPSGYVSATPARQRGWRGDISHWKLRRLQPKRTTEVAGKMVFPRKLSKTRSAEGRALPGGGFQTRSGPAPRKGLPGIVPGKGAKTIGKAINRTKGNRPLKGGGSASGRLWNNKQTPIDPRIPPAGAQRAGKFAGNIKRSQLGYQDQGEEFSGYIKTKKPLKGGGSVSGRLWNNKQAPIDPRIPPSGAQRAGRYSGNIKRGQLGYQDQGEEFSGYIKTKRPLKGGGSVSGKLWNNKQAPIDPRIPPSGAQRAGKYSGNIKRGQLGYQDQGEEFSGYIKAKKPLKGGGSVSGKLWNNKQSPIDPRIPPSGAQRAGRYSGNIRSSELRNYQDQGEEFSGYIKTKKPLKGGGSVSGKLWNNKQTPIDPRIPPTGAQRAGRYTGNIRSSELRNLQDQGEEFSGYIKTKRPLKGGGSVSGKLWNNKGEPIDVINAGKGTVRASQFSGNMKTKRPEKGGGSVSFKLWNNKEQPILVRVPTRNDAKEANYSGRSKVRKNYVQSPNAVEESLKKNKPDKSTFMVSGLQVRVGRENYKSKPNAPKGSMPGLGPTRSTVKASEYSRTMKVYWKSGRSSKASDESLLSRKPLSRWEKGVVTSGRTKSGHTYRHNPNSADEALKVTYQGRANARVEAFQGNVKMHKYNDRRLHPDASFAHSYRDNVDEERTILMDFKLFWSKLFRKSETQPDHLKEKDRRPRYDKREQGMWYD